MRLAKMVNDHQKLFDPCLMCGKAVCECEYTEDDLKWMEVNENAEQMVCLSR